MTEVDSTSLVCVTRSLPINQLSYLVNFFKKKCKQAIAGLDWLSAAFMALLFQHRRQLHSPGCCNFSTTVSSLSRFPTPLARLLPPTTANHHPSSLAVVGRRGCIATGGRAEQDETISQHPTVCALWKLFWGCRTIQRKLVTLESISVWSWNKRSVSDFPWGDGGS